MLGFGNDLYDLNLAKDRVTQPLELVVREIIGVVAAAPVQVVNQLGVYTVPNDRVFYLESFGGTMTPEAPALPLSLSLRVTIAGISTSVIGSGWVGINSSASYDLSWSGAVAIAPGAVISVAASFSTAALNGFNNFRMSGFTIPRGSISLG